MGFPAATVAVARGRRLARHESRRSQKRKAESGRLWSHVISDHESRSRFARHRDYHRAGANLKHDKACLFNQSTQPDQHQLDDTLPVEDVMGKCTPDPPGDNDTRHGHGSEGPDRQAARPDSLFPLNQHRHAAKWSIGVECACAPTITMPLRGPKLRYSVVISPTPSTNIHHLHLFIGLFHHRFISKVHLP